MTALLPCPFCANPAGVLWDRDREQFRVECVDCGASLPGGGAHSREGTIAAWNRRAPTDARRAAEEMRERAAGVAEGAIDDLSHPAGWSFNRAADWSHGTCDAQSAVLTAIRALPLPGEEGVMGWREVLEAAQDDDLVAATWGDERDTERAAKAILSMPPADRIALARELLAGTGRVVARDVPISAGAQDGRAEGWRDIVGARDAGWNACRAAMMGEE